MVAFTTSCLVLIAISAIGVWYGKRRPVGTPLTWGEAMVAAVYVFFVMFWAYGVVPHLWLAWADGDLQVAPNQSSCCHVIRRRQCTTTNCRASSGRPDHRHLPDAARHHRRRHLPRRSSVSTSRAWPLWQNRGKKKPTDRRQVRLRPAARARGSQLTWRPMPTPRCPSSADDYVLQEVDAEWLSRAVKPKQFIHIDQSECIMCEGCVDICPWKCIFMVSPSAIAEAIGTERPGPIRATMSSSPSTTTSALGARCASTAARPASSSSVRSGPPRQPVIHTSAPIRMAMATACGSADGRA